ncbi:protein of unknown function [Zunongwangia mangrovi]|uniref:DUF4421 domain-containing protein n=1 Tax=Zunongwangia mangrovi TaxID=1334022 RepID=A0A1I1I1D8_9FLAO|nr:DUF4421 family protein [Zunongwangia mangrovi]SFC27040.1 protein of unknown function [Zunongwangia mangrovi]
MFYKSTFLLPLFFFSCFTQVTRAQQKDSSAIISYAEKMQIKLNVDSHLENYYISTDDIDQELNLALNNDLRLTLLLDYKIFSLSYSFTPDFLPGNHGDEEKGESSYSDFSISLFPGQFVQQLTYQRMKGFYVVNSNDYNDNLTAENPYLLFPDLKRTFYGGSTAYILNPNFSIENLVYQREWQRYSTGSFVPRFNYGYTEFSNNFEDYRGKEKDFDLSLDLNYYYNWVLAEMFNLSPYVYGGLGTRFESYRQRGENINERENNTYFTQEYGGGIQLGFNTDTFLMGARVSYKSLNYKNDIDTRIQNDSWYGLFFIGYRLDPPENMKRIADQF